MIMNVKQKKIKIEPRIKLNYNIHTKFCPPTIWEIGKGFSLKKARLKRQEYPTGTWIILMTNVSLLFGCSILEPGPVGTSMGENLEACTEKYDTPTADQKTLELQGVCSAKIAQDFKSCLQNVNEVATIVKKILLSEKPNLRYQTNDNFNPDAVKAKLADPTGNDLVEMLNKKYWPC